MLCFPRGHRTGETLALVAETLFNITNLRLIFKNPLILTLFRVCTDCLYLRTYLIIIIKFTTGLLWRGGYISFTLRYIFFLLLNFGVVWNNFFSKWYPRICADKMWVILHFFQITWNRSLPTGYVVLAPRFLSVNIELWHNGNTFEEVWSGGTKKRWKRREG